MNTYTNNLKESITEERKYLLEEKILKRTRSITIVLENIFQARDISASMRLADCFGTEVRRISEQALNMAFSKKHKTK